MTSSSVQSNTSRTADILRAIAASDPSPSLSVGSEPSMPRSWEAGWAKDGATGANSSTHATSIQTLDPCLTPGTRTRALSHISKVARNNPTGQQGGWNLRTIAPLSAAMRKRHNWLRPFAGFAVALPCALASGAQEVEPSTDEAQPSRVEASERWVPGLSIFGMGMIQGRSGSIDSVERGEHSDSTRGVFATLGLSAELSTPVLSFAPSRPRVFVHVDASLSFDAEEPITNEGDPGPVEVQSVSGSGVVKPLAGVQGLGSATRVKTLSPTVSAGLGLAFELPLWDRTLRVKPSVEWEWQQDELRQLFGDAESNGSNPDVCSPSCRTLTIDATRTEGFHSIGPGLELEVESARIGDAVLTVYATGRAYSLLGSRGFDLQTTESWENNVSTPPREPSTVTSTYERDPWHFSVGVGIRFLWRPE
jgi:hypothetical protein